MKTKLSGKVENLFFTITDFKYKDALSECKENYPSLTGSSGYDTLSNEQIVLLKKTKNMEVSKNFTINDSLTLDDVKKSQDELNLKSTSKPKLILHGIKTEKTDVKDLLKLECYFSVVISKNISFELSEKEKNTLSQLVHFIDQFGFFADYDEFLSDISHGINDFELTKKTYGDGWTKSTTSYFNKVEYKKLSQLCKSLNLEIPEYVCGD